MSSQDKRVRWSQAAIETFSEDEQLFKLSNQEVSALQTAIAVMEWKTRWLDGDISFYSPFSGKLAEKLMTPIDFCAEMINCIENDTDVQAALQNYLQTTGQNGGVGNPEQPLSDTILNGNIIPSDALCTNDNKYAMALAVVQILDRSIKDFFELVEVVTNGAEYAVTLADNGGVFTSGPAAAAETAAWLQDSIQEEYDAAYNVITEEEFACAIYCQFLDCNLTFENIYDAYQSVISVTLPDVDDIFAVIEFLIDIVTLNDTLVVGTSHLLALTLLRWGSSWANIGSYASVQAALEASKNDEVSVPVSCECIFGWCKKWDFSIDNGGFSVVTAANIGGGVATARGSYGASYWQNTLGDASDGSPQNGIIIYLDAGDSFTAKYAEIIYSKGVTSGTQLISVALQVTDDPSTQQHIINQNQPNAAQNETSIEVTATKTGRYLRITLTTGADKEVGFIKVHSLEIGSDVGANPFGADNC
jgi:hypothetical protein